MTTDNEPLEDPAEGPPHGAFCGACGARVAAGDRFCRSCGSPVVPADEPTDTSAVADGEGGGPEVSAQDAGANADPETVPYGVEPVTEIVGVEEDDDPDTVVTPAAAVRPAATPQDAEDDGGGGAADGRPARRGSNRALLGLVAAALLVMAVSAVAVVVLAGGDRKSGDEQTAIANRQALKAPFDELMHQRDALFAIERQYRAAMKATNRTLNRYRTALTTYKRETKRIDDEFAAAFDECGRTAIPCPDPTYPDAPATPDVSDQRAALRAASSDLQELRARLTGISPAAALGVLHNQLLAATDSLKETADHNADVLSEAVTQSDGEGEDSGGVDLGKLATLRTEQAIPAIVAGNQAALQLIRKMGLNVTDYDVPGGRDLDPHDNSITTAA